MVTTTTTKTKDIKVLNLEDTARAMRDTAINEARIVLPKFYDDKDLASLLKETIFVDNFKHIMAGLIADELVQNDSTIEEIYFMDPDMNPDAEIGEAKPIILDWHLICLVEKPNAALKSIISGLDSTLTTAIRELPSDQFTNLETVLDVSLVTKQDIKERKGYAALLSSIFAPPLKVWPQ
jgi:hypothetical protein